MDVKIVIPATATEIQNLDFGTLGANQIEIQITDVGVAALQIQDFDTSNGAAARHVDDGTNGGSTIAGDALGYVAAVVGAENC